MDKMCIRDSIIDRSGQTQVAPCAGDTDYYRNHKPGPVDQVTEKDFLNIHLLFRLLTPVLSFFLNHIYITI